MKNMETSLPQVIRKRRRENHLCPIRDIVDRIGDAWSLLILAELGVARHNDEARRFNELRRSITGISPRMLTETLRHLERDGYVSRVVFSSTPPSVEYRLTDLGLSLCGQIRSLTDWSINRQEEIHQARSSYDHRPEILLKQVRICDSKH